MFVMTLRDEFDVKNSNNEMVKIYGNGKCEFVEQDKIGNIIICYGEKSGKVVDKDKVESAATSCMDVRQLIYLTKQENIIDALNYMNDVQKDVFFEIEDGEKLEIDDNTILEQIEEIKKSIDKSFIPSHVTSLPKIEDLYKKITSNIRCQDNQVKVILSAVYNNLLLSEMDFDNDEIAKLKQNVLICGPTGTGKTAVINQISKLIKRPMVIEDATQYTEAGYEGGDLNDIFAHLINSSKSIDEAERGIIVLDEIDKLANNTPSSNDVSKTGVQESLLKIMEGSILHVNIGSKLNPKTVDFDTSKLTIIGLGAFEGIEKIKDERLKDKKYMGFIKPEEEKKVLSKGYIINDFKSYGMMSQLLGRFGQIVQMNSLDKDSLKDIILNSDSSILKLKQKFYSFQGVTLHYDDCFIDAVVNKAIEYGCGARSLNAILNQIFSEGQFNSFMDKYTYFEINKETVENHKKYILK